jgi:hypothetical protein
MSLQAMKQFKAATGKDLWYVLIHVFETYLKHADKPVLTLLRELYSCIDFDTASHVLHALIQAEDKSIELDQVQDGMYRVGWRPVEEEDSGKRQPYPLVLVQAAQLIDGQLTEVIKKK